ncbi:solute carrier family 35, member C2 [Nematocida major]|uniref:solute carrier family 35, member C2 n=1 Tax=Nematocida major TaxID=1912982 RepID=UPI002007B2C4|nr:solute carrier family 35, member C2 [Nematocida major]KAH9385954.1 solute carrier family 35, member C2 [Nematocida major]
MNTQELLGVGACMGFFFSSSLGMTFFTSHFLSQTGYNFKFPLFYFSLHHLTHFVLSAFCIWYFKKQVLHEQVIESPLPYIMREKIGSPLEAPLKKEKPENTLETLSANTNSALRPILCFLSDIGAFNVWIVVCCFIGSIDSGFSGKALTRISLPVYTMLKSTTPVFILFARFVFQLERPSITLIVIICMIASGISLAAKSEAMGFDAKYGLMTLGACVMAGFRWGFLEYFIKHSIKKNKSILHSLSVLSLLSGLFLLAGFFLFEGPIGLFNFCAQKSAGAAAQCLLLIVATGAIGFFGCLAEFLVISKTNVMVSSVVIIIKEIVILCISVHQHSLTLTSVNIFGLALSIVGIFLFTFRSVLFPEAAALSSVDEKALESAYTTHRVVQSPEKTPVTVPS